MVLTLSRQFVTLTGTGKAVRVFFFNLNFNFLDTFWKNRQMSNVTKIHAVGVDGNDVANSH